MPEKEATSLNKIPELNTSLESFPGGKSSIEKTLVVEPKSEETQLPGKEWSNETLSERLHILGKSRSPYSRQIYPMKAFRLEQMELFEENSTSLSETVDTANDETVRQMRSTYLFEMYPMKSFDFSTFSNNLASDKNLSNSESASVTETATVKASFLENVKNISFAYLKQFWLFRK